MYVPPYRVLADDHVVARLHQARNRDELSGLAAGHRQPRDSVFERRDALLQHVRGRIHDARIDVAELLQPEQSGRMRGVVEHERRGLVDGYRARLGGRIGRITRVERAGIET